MTQYRIVVRQLVEDDALSDPNDRRKNPKGTYFCDADSKDRALAHFRLNVPIGCLTDFDISASALNEARSVRKWRRK